MGQPQDWIVAFRWREDENGHLVWPIIAYLRLVDGKSPENWQTRGQFFKAAAESMRRILIDLARHKKSHKAGGHMQRVEMEDAEFSLNHSPDDLLALDQAITELPTEH